MNILLIYQYFLQVKGSGGLRFNEMTRKWSEMGHHITVLSGMIYHNSGEKYPEYKGKIFVNEYHAENIKVIRCHDSEGSQKSFIARLRVYFTFVCTSLWAGLFKAREKYDIIIVSSPPLFVGIPAYILSLIKRVPYVFEVRDLWPESAIDTGVLTNNRLIKLAYWFESFIYRKAKLINVLTPAFYETLKEKKGVPEQKLIMIPNASDFSFSEEILKTFDREAFRKKENLEGKFVIIYVGAHGVANHLDQLLDAGKALEDTNVLFLLIGQGMEKERLKQKVKEMNMINVRFMDPVPKKEVFKYILASEMGASILKKVDTFKTVYSNKTFDYMSCKKPILMAIDGVSKELIEKADAGIFVEPENPEDFAGKIRIYIKNPDLVKIQGENGYRYAKQYFDRNVLAKQYLTEIQKICE